MKTTYYVHSYMKTFTCPLVLDLINGSSYEDTMDLIPFYIMCSTHNHGISSFTFRIYITSIIDTK